MIKLFRAPSRNLWSHTLRPGIVQSGITPCANRIGVVLLAVPVTVLAGGHGPGMDFLVMLVLGFYAALCVVSVPTALLLRGSLSKRITFGLGAPLIGMVSGVALGEVWPNFNFTLYVVISVLPIIGLVIAVLYQMVQKRVRQTTVIERNT